MQEGSGGLVPVLHPEEEIDFMSALKRTQVLTVYVYVSYHLVNL